MSLGQLDISSFSKAVDSLEEAVLEMKKQPNNKFVRDASILRFENTYEICAKMLKRYLELTESSSEDVDQMTFSTLIRTGSEKGLLLNGWDFWKPYREARNITSHTYDEKKANAVYKVIPAFLKDAKYLLVKLQERISSHE